MKNATARRRSRRSARRRGQRLDCPWRAARRSARRRPRMRPSSIGRNESDRGSISSESSATAGMRNTATCALDASAISAASLMLPRCGDHDGAAVLGRVADDRDDDSRDEEVAEPAFSAKVSIEPTRISAISAVTTVATPSTISAVRRLQPVDIVVVVGAPAQPVPAQVDPGHADVEDEQHDRERDREVDDRVALRVAVDSREPTGSGRGAPRA